MNEIVNKVLLARDNFMPETHLRQSGFTYSACGSFTKNKGTRGSRHIYENQLDRYQRSLASMLFIFFDKKSSGRAAMLANKSAIKKEILCNKTLAEELHKPIIRKFKKKSILILYR